MMIAVMGIHPELSLAELSSVYGIAKVSKLTDELALIDDNKLHILGGTIKLAKIVDKLPPTNIDRIDLTNYIQANKKLSLGLSIYGQTVSVREINRIGITLKQQLRSSGAAIRVVPNKQAALSSAQVLHNKLVSKGVELIIAKTAKNTFVAQTVYVQDIDAYAARDHGRPYRDAQVGMLPPKLAQIMINLAAPPDGAIILDPFCGTGVVLQEALLMGYKANGSDINERMVSYTAKNLEWLKQQHQLKSKYQVSQADARNARFASPIDAVVSEVDLGPPLSQTPNPSKLKRIASEANDLITAFLRNLYGQVSSGTPICIAIPCWQSATGLVSLPLIDQIGAIGYNFKKIGTQQRASLIYRRPNQFVGRQLLIIERQ